MLELSLHVFDLILPNFCSNDFPETWAWFVLSQNKLVPEIELKYASKIFFTGSVVVQKMGSSQTPVRIKTLSPVNDIN